MPRVVAQWSTRVKSKSSTPVICATTIEIAGTTGDKIPLLSSSFDIGSGAGGSSGSLLLLLLPLPKLPLNKRILSPVDPNLLLLGKGQGTMI